MEKEYTPIPMLERWKNDIPKGETIGRCEIPNEERIEARKSTLALKVKRGIITETEAQNRLEKLYEELGMLVLQ